MATTNILWRTALVLMVTLSGMNVTAARVTPASLCSSPGKTELLTKGFSIESRWKANWELEMNSGQATITTHELNRGKAYGVREVWFRRDGLQTKLMSIKNADRYMGWEGKTSTINGADGVTLIALISEAGMRFVGVSLWVSDAFGPPHQITLRSSKYRQAIRVANMGHGIDDSSSSQLIFKNPHIECEDDEPRLVEESYIFGTQEVACWKLDANWNVTPTVLYRNSNDDRSDVAGARKATITHFTNRSGMIAVQTLVLTQAPDPNDGPPSCSTLLSARGR